MLESVTRGLNALNQEANSFSLQSTKLKYQKTSIKTNQVFPKNDGNSKMFRTSQTYLNLSYTKNKFKMLQDKSKDYFLIQSTSINIEIETTEIKSFELPNSKDTADKILNFAKKLAGGDSGKIDLLKNACKKGFRQAESIFGGRLPDVSYNTYDLVMEGFEKWRENSA